MVKAIIIPFEKDRDNININERDKNKGYSLEELMGIYAGRDNTRTALYEYDEFGNIIKEAWYEGVIDK